MCKVKSYGLPCVCVRACMCVQGAGKVELVLACFAAADRAGAAGTTKGRAMLKKNRQASDLVRMQPPAALIALDNTVLLRIVQFNMGGSHCLHHFSFKIKTFDYQ